MPRKRIVPEAPPTETYQPTDTITLDIADGRAVVRGCLPGPRLPEKPLPSAGMADLSTIQELRVRLIREGFYGASEERQLQALSRVVVTGMMAEDFAEEARRRFGPWPRPERDPKGRIVWTRREIASLGPVIRGAVAGSAGAVMR